MYVSNKSGGRVTIKTCEGNNKVAETKYAFQASVTLSGLMLLKLFLQCLSHFVLRVSGLLPALCCSIQEGTSHKSGQGPKMRPRTKKK